ncbi:MAG: hypothetical protein ABIH42_08500 [Planctomycetota bacterium]
MQSPTQILEDAYNSAKNQSFNLLLSKLPDDLVEFLKVIVKNAETQKGVLGVTLTSIVYKVLNPSQDIRKHQQHMPGGYSGRTFDTKYMTPFLKDKFSHFAMAESAWLTRSLEQPHSYDSNYPGKIQNKEVKSAFINTLNRLQTNSDLAPKILVGLLAVLIEASAEDTALFTGVTVSDDLTIAKILEAVDEHIHYRYGRGVHGTARIPVLVIYSVYNLLMPDVKRYSGKKLAPLQSHTSPDARSKSLGDIEITNSDNSCFEAIEVKYLKPISVDMIHVAYRKIKDTKVDRYYILTTNEPNFDNVDDENAVMQNIADYRRGHPCQIIVNGVIPSLKYYLRLVSAPQAFADEYTKWLEYEYRRASGIKKIHLQIWQEIRQQILKVKQPREGQALSVLLKGQPR